MEGEIAHMRVLSNRNLTVRGPLVLDAEPFAFTQGELVAVDAGEQTLDVRIFDGYHLPLSTGRIEFFTPEGVMLPHGQDAVQVRLLSQSIPILAMLDLPDIGTMCPSAGI